MNENGTVIDSPTVNAAVVGVDYAAPAAKVEETESEQSEPTTESESQPAPQSAAEG